MALFIGTLVFLTVLGSMMNPGEPGPTLDHMRNEPDGGSPHTIHNTENNQ